MKNVRKASGRSEKAEAHLREWRWMVVGRRLLRRNEEKVHPIVEIKNELIQVLQKSGGEGGQEMR